MARSLVLMVSSPLLSSLAVCQSPACPEAQTMQSLLTEVHQLRQDLQNGFTRGTQSADTHLPVVRIAREYQAEQIKQEEGQVGRPNASEADGRYDRRSGSLV